MELMLFLITFCILSVPIFIFCQIPRNEKQLALFTLILWLTVTAITIVAYINQDVIPDVSQGWDAFFLSWIWYAAFLCPALKFIHLRCYKTRVSEIKMIIYSFWFLATIPVFVWLLS